MPFVPDTAQDPQRSGRFVPDKAAATPKAAAPPGAPPDDGGSMFDSRGPGEALMNMGSSMIAKPVSDIAGLAATGKEMISPTPGGGDPAGFKREVQDKLTYQPRTHAGRQMAEYNPLALASKGVDWGMGKVEQGIKGIPVPPSMEIPRDALASGVREAGNQAPGLLGAKGGAGMRERLPGVAAGLKADETLNAAKDSVRETSQAAGYLTPPESGIKAAAAGLTGKARTERRLSMKNEENATKRLGNEAGIADGKPLTPDVLEQGMEAQYKRYDALKAAVGPEVTVTPQFTQTLSTTLKEAREQVKLHPELEPAVKILTEFEKRVSPKAPSAGEPAIFGTVKKQTADFPSAPAFGMSNLLEKVAAEQPGSHTGIAPPPSMPVGTVAPVTLSTNFVTKQISALRKAAKRDFRTGAEETGTVRLGVASQLEDLLEHNIGELGGQQLADFREARTKLAQLHLLERVTNEATGMVELPKLATASDSAAYKGVLTGEFKTAADFAKAYRKAAQKGTGEAKPTLSVFDGLFAMSSVMAGHPIVGAAELGSRFAIPAMAERGMLQNKKPPYEPGGMSQSMPGLMELLGPLMSQQPRQ